MKTMLERMESAFRYSLKKEMVIGVLLIGMFIIMRFMNREAGIIPDNLNRSDVNAFDRWLMFPHNRLLDNIKFLFLAVALAFPIISPLAKSIRSKGTWLTYGIMYAQAFLFTSGIRTILKNAIYRYRPYMYFDGFPAASDFHRSFPSGTAALAFLPAAFISVTFSAEFPSSPWRIPVVVGSYVMAVGIGATRIFNGTHFLTDVLAGAAIGIFFGWLIPTLHKRAANINISLPPV